MEYDSSWAQDAPGFDVPSPPGMTFHPFQLAGIKYASERAHSIIGDQPGLGKTMQAIGLANLSEARRVLVICPGKVRLQWVKRIREWSTIPRVNVYPILRGADGVNPHANYVVVSYELARSGIIHKLLCSTAWDLLVLDEAHYLKTPEAQRTRSVFGGGMGEFADDNFLARRSRRVVALTGTPLPNRPRECYTLARSLCWEAIDFMSRDAFEHRYNPSVAFGSHVEERKGRLPELQARLRCNIMVRRLKRDVLPQLPKVTWELAYIEADGAVKKALRAENLLGIDPNDLEGADAQLLGQVSTVRREMGEAKAPRVVDHVLMLLDGGVEKIVVFGHHRSVLDTIEQGLTKYGVVRADGRTTAVQQYRRIDQFQKDPETRIFLGNLETAGTGVDGLQEVCSHMVFAEASWTPKDNEQAVDRLGRDGQRNAVLAQFLVAPGSLDERVLGTAIEKQHGIHASLDAR